VSVRRQVWISLFIAVYFCTVWFWLWSQLTPDAILAQKLKPSMETVLGVSGLMQRWTMFAPTVRDTNVYCSAVVTFADGSTKYYECPRLNLRGLVERSRQQKMNKIFVDGWEYPTFDDYRPYLARFVARCNANASNPPKMVALGMSLSFIPKFDRWVSRADVPDPNLRETLFVYAVKPEDLQ
jgi:hypothetical protein